MGRGDITQRAKKNHAPRKALSRRSAYNPKTKKWFGWPDNYVPDPVHYRRDWWGEVGERPTTWDAVNRAAPKLKANGHPIGIGMSNELDSNMALIALMQCFGSFIQSRDARVTIKNKGTIE